MDPVLMVGAWAGALLALIALLTAAWKAFVTAVEAVIATSIGRVGRDMDDIEERLSQVEYTLQFVREQLKDLHELVASMWGRDAR